MNDVDLLLALGFALDQSRNAAELRARVKRLIKRVPGHRRPALGLFLKSRDPRAMITTLLDNWESIPDEDPAPTVGRDPKTGRFYSLARKPS